MSGILWIIVVGFVAGIIARFLSPGPNNPIVNEWTPGEHTVKVVWDTIDGLADPGEYEWTFRIG